MTLAQIRDAMERIAPTHLAEEWDNVGLLSGHRSSLVKKALLTIDITPAVHDEAIRLGMDLIVSYHPPIFKPIKHLRIDGDEPPALAVALASYGIWVYSPHTALDTVEGGTNDVLAARIGAKVTGSFSHYPAMGEYLKLVAFVPEPHVEEVADSVFAAGAGHIGQKAKYTRCSFRNPGTGTFQGDDSTNPTVGTAGQYEKVPEIRFETILPSHLAGDVIDALRRVHPYEEPAFDLLRMETPPEQVGLGRYAELPRPEKLHVFAERMQARPQAGSGIGDRSGAAPGAASGGCGRECGAFAAGSGPSALRVRPDRRAQTSRDAGLSGGGYWRGITRAFRIGTADSRGAGAAAEGGIAHARPAIEPRRQGSGHFTVSQLLRAIASRIGDKNGLMTRSSMNFSPSSIKWPCTSCSSGRRLPPLHCRRIT